MNDREFIIAFLLARAGAITDSRMLDSYRIFSDAEDALKLLNKNFPRPEQGYTSTPAPGAVDDSDVPF